MQIVPASKYKNRVITLLQSLHLPTEDLTGNLENFFVALGANEIIGTVGLEIYGEYGLLRSLAVDPQLQGKGIGHSLVSYIEQYAQNKGLKELYLLTETAKDYFEKKTYQLIARDKAAEAIKQSAEFSHVCPQSAVLMKKTIN